ncbi:MAG: AAA family ATPase [Myxococcales bacterium]|nr:AAA family ATPase [Myxococcales bacterium]
MTVRLTIASQKGGSGKTTAALNLSLAFSEKGHRTLLVDLDPQGGIGHALRKGETEMPGVADALMQACTPEQALVHTKLPGLTLLPRGRLDPVDACEFERALLGPGVLEGLVRSVEGDFDLVVLDTPSGVGMPTRAALAVSQFALVPVQAEPLALRGVQQILRVIEHVRYHENPRLQLLGLLPSMVDRDSDVSMGVLVAAWRDLCGVLETTIPRAAVFAKASEAGVPVGYLAGPPSPEARRFGILATEVYGLIRDRYQEATEDVERPARQLL